MLLAAQILTALVLLIHVYIFLLETVLFKTRGRRVFAISAADADIVGRAMFNQGFYNLFLAAALALGFLLSGAPATLITLFGLGCVAVAGIVGAITVQFRILYVQTVPAVAAITALHFSGTMQFV
jgi:putative membrane protein